VPGVASKGGGTPGVAWRGKEGGGAGVTFRASGGGGGKQGPARCHMEG
jgi:hypothetical protein